MDFTIIDNSEMVKEEFEAAVLRALTRCGMQAEGYAKDLAPVDTGLLRNSITYAVSGEQAAISEYKADKGVKKGKYNGTAPESENGGTAVYIGTNVEYAPYIELGSGKHYAGGRKTPWSYQDAQGNWNSTRGQEAQPYLKPAVTDYAQTYQNIIKDELGNG